MSDIISIIGVGYVGLPLAIKLSKYFKVYGYDANNERIDQLKKGIDIFKDQKISNKEKKKIKFTNNINELENSNIFIVTVPTPVKKNKNPDLSHLISASKTVGSVMKRNSIVIYESTVYPGCTEEVCVPVLEKYSKLKANFDFFYGYSPERINVGDKKHKIENIKKIVSSSNKYSMKKIFKVYNSIIRAGVYKAESIKVAEAAKVIENTQRDLNIALINELSIIFSKLGINTNEVLNAALTKWNFVKYEPGLVGGHCVGVDPYYLTYKSKKIGYNPKVILSGRKTNDQMSKHVFDLVNKYAKKNHIDKKRYKVLVLGYSFKENCSDIRNSKIEDLVNHFLKKKTYIRIHDPLVIITHLNKYHQKLFLDKSEINNLKDNFFDVLILAVPHKEILGKFKFFKKKIKKNSLIIDIKSALEKNKFSQITL